MQLSMKCSVAVHCLIFIHEAKGRAKVTSPLLAQSTGCNPVVIRSTLSALKKAGLITVPRGTGGAELCPGPRPHYAVRHLQRTGAQRAFVPDRHPSLRRKVVPRGPAYPPGAAAALPANRGRRAPHHGGDYAFVYDLDDFHRQLSADSHPEQA